MSKNKSKNSKKKTKAPAFQQRSQAVQQANSRAGMRSRLRPWMMVAIVVLLTVAVRIRLLGIPLERDEGEYAYGGQLLLQGIPPYKLIFSMKFPGIYAAYAAIMAVFGQTIVGIHLGFMLVNAAAIVLIYLLGKRLLTPAAGVAASAAYALLSIGQGVNGSQAHATHFVVLAALGGTLLLLRGIDTRRWPVLLLSGVLYGIAILMKQHGFLFVIFGMAYLAWDNLIRCRNAWLSTVKSLAIFISGVTVPLALTGFALWWAGVFDNFWFWTFKYASEYEQELQSSAGIDLFRRNFSLMVRPNLAVWIIAAAGLVLIWWRKEERIAAIFISGFLFFSFLAVCPGLYFRPHYFVLMLPVIALLAGASVGIAVKQWPRASWLEYGIYGAALVFSVMQQQKYLFRMTPIEISRAMYMAHPFPEAVQIARYIRTHSGQNATIAVLGSEPEIFFYANRHSSSGNIYMYGLMEDQPYAVTMQKEFIRDVELSQPEYAVFATSNASWLRTPNSPKEIFDWWAAYQPQHYRQIVAVADIVSPDHTEYRWGDDARTYKLKSQWALVVYKKTDPRLYRAETLEEQGKLDEASQVYRNVLATEPNDYETHNILGALLSRQGLTEEALKEFRISLTIKPDQAMVYSSIGMILAQKHQFRNAAEEFTKALQFDPADAKTHNDLGVAQYQLGDYAKAAEQFSEAMRIDPGFANAKRNFDLTQGVMKNKAVEKR